MDAYVQTTQAGAELGLQQGMSFEEAVARLAIIRGYTKLILLCCASTLFPTAELVAYRR